MGDTGGAAESELLARQYFSVLNTREYDKLLELVHPDIEAILKVRPGDMLEGSEAVARFLHEVVAERSVFEAVVSEVHPLDDRRVVVEGRMRWMDEERVLRDDPVVWALEFEGGLLRRSIAGRSVTEAQALLTAMPSNAE